MPAITLEEAKRHLRITGSENDARLGQNLAAAEEHVARYIGAPLTVDGTVPAGIREAILQQAAFLYDGTPVDLAGLLMPYRSDWFLMARSPQLARLTRKLEAIPEAVREAVAPALQKSGDEIAGHMRHLAPKETGALAASIVVTPGGSSTPAYSQPGGSQVVPVGAVAITAGNVDVRYPHLQEYGTTEHTAQPFFWPAYRLLRKRTGTRIKRALGKAVRDGWRS